MPGGHAPAPARYRAGDLDTACELLRALGAPHRLAIVLELSRGTRCVHELVDALGISQSLASQHLRVLRASGLVTGARRGKETAYSLAGGLAARIAQDVLAHGSGPLPSQRSSTWWDSAQAAAGGTGPLTADGRAGPTAEAGDPEVRPAPPAG